MTTTPRPARPALSTLEPKPDGPTPADRGAAILAHHLDLTQQWGTAAQSTLARVLADLIAAADEDPDLSFPDALAEAWRRLD